MLRNHERMLCVLRWGGSQHVRANWGCQQDSPDSCSKRAHVSSMRASCHDFVAASGFASSSSHKRNATPSAVYESRRQREESFRDAKN